MREAPGPGGVRVSVRVEEHPAAAPDRHDPIGAEGSADRDHQGVASAFAEIGDPHGSGELGAADDATGPLGEGVQHGPLLLGEMSQGRDEITHRDLGRFRLEGSGDRSGP